MTDGAIGFSLPDITEAEIDAVGRVLRSDWITTGAECLGLEEDLRSYLGVEHVVAEIAAGSAGAGSGLAYRILESQFRLNIPRLFAALALLSLTGVVIFLVLSGLSHLVLRRWHESALGDRR